MTRLALYHFKSLLALLFLIPLLLSSCVSKSGSSTYAAQALGPVPPFTQPAIFTYSPRSLLPGAATEHITSFDNTTEKLQSHTMVFQHSGAHKWKGFLALGPAGRQIGKHTIDWSVPFDGIPDHTTSIRSIDNTTAYGDSNQKGFYSPLIDAIITYTYTNGYHTLTVVLPNGGDGSKFVKTGFFPVRVTTRLFSGLLDNPAAGGTRNYVANFTSVDPDSGDANDGIGTPPSTFTMLNSYAITSSAPGVSVYTDKASYVTGDILTKYIDVSTQPVAGGNFDVYVGVLLPNGSFFFISNYNKATKTFSFAPGSLLTPATWKPALAGLTLPPGSSFMRVPALTHLFSGAEPAGQYVLYAWLTNAGTTTIAGRQDTFPFSFTP